MLTLDQDYLFRLRELASRGATPAQMVRDLLDRLKPEEPRNAMLALYFITAFDLEAYQVSSIFGWDPDGKGPLGDAELNKYLGRHLQNKAGGEVPPEQASRRDRPA